MSDSASLSAPAPSSDADLLSSLGLSEEAAAELLSSADDLMAAYGQDITVEQFLEQHCNKHVSALESYCDARIAALQQEAQQAIQEIKAQFAQ